MWYLDFTFKYIMAMGFMFAGLGFLLKDGFANIRRFAMSAVFLAFIFFYSKYLGLFICAWILAVYILSRFILSVKEERVRKTVFALSIIFNTVVFVSAGLIYPKTAGTPFAGMFLGYSYAFLKLVDVIYYAYYYEEGFDIFELAEFILFVPAFTSGPIMAFSDYKKQACRKIKDFSFEQPIKRIIIGFFKKIVLLKFLYLAHDNILLGDLNFVKSFLLLLLFYIIGYLDFSGYSDIAIGFGRIMGFDLPENFKNPFLSPSLTVFWRNWHISLGTWIKNHISVLIKPENRFQSGLSSFVIMVFIGLWHKFSLLFLLWGIWHGIFLFIESFFSLGIVNKKRTNPVVYYLRCMITNLIVTFGCLFFYSDTATAERIFLGFFRFMG